MASRDEKPADFLLPESVKTWFTHLYTHFISGNVTEMLRLYDREFQNLTNNYFKQSPWPEPVAIESLIENDPNFLLLYKQVYYRHLFAKTQPDMTAKAESWDTYCQLFDGILNDKLEIVALPSQWIFDIVGEFLYQYQSFCQYRAKISNRSDHEIQVFKDYAHIWSTKQVLNYLNALVHKSGILHILKAEAQGEKTLDTDKKEDETAEKSKELMKELGYFALICLSRAHVLFGDYYTSLKLLEPIDFYNKRQTSAHGNGKNVDAIRATEQIYEKAPACHVSVFYHMGFAQLMLQQFGAAIRTFTTIILQVQRSRNYYSRCSDYEQLNKLTEKSLALVAIALYLCPGQRANDQIQVLLRDKYSDKQNKLLKGDISVLSELYSFSCPKFILPGLNQDGTTVVSQRDVPSEPIDGENDMEEEENGTKTSRSRSSEASQLQNTFFQDLVERNQHIPVLRSYVKLYRSIDLHKLANFCEVEPNVARAELMAYKLNHQSLKSDVQFHLEKDLLIVDDEMNNQRTGEYFMNHIQKFARIVDDNTLLA